MEGSSQSLDEFSVHHGFDFSEVLSEGLYYTLATIMALLAHALEYFITPRVILTHLVAGGLFVSLTKQGVELVPVIQTAILQELVTYVLWLVVPHSLGTAAALYVCVYLYELILGPKVTTRDGAQFLTDDDIGSTLKESSPRLQFDVESDGSLFRIKTYLRFIVYARTSKRGDDGGGQYADGIVLGDVGTVQKGYDIEISRAVRAQNATNSNCFYITIDGCPTTITFIAPDEETRDTWVTVLQQLCSSQLGDIKLLWLEKACKDAGIVPSACNGVINPDQLERILMAAHRSTDKAYLSEVLKAQTKAAKTNGNASGAKELSTLFDALTFKAEIEIVYQRTLQKANSKTVLKARSLWNFIKEEQKETELEISTVRSLMKDNETVLPSVYMTSVGFTNYMMSEYNSIFKNRCRSVYQDMTRPLSHYFINTSHNTYLTKDQLKSKSSVDMYISALKRGCKCVELDTWDGPNNEPIIYHGHTLTSKILFKDVITAVRDYAFVVSDYPVILSFENHCSVEQQKVIANHLISILQDKLYTKPMAEDETSYPSPSDLRGFVIVKYKKLQTGADPAEPEEALEYEEWSDEELSDEELKDVTLQLDEDNDSIEYDESPKKKGSKGILGVVKGIKGRRNNDKKKEEPPKIAQELSDLVIYCQSVRFKGFERAKQRNAFYEMSSLGEKKAVKFAKEEGCEFAEYNCRQLTRVYPAGGRVDSSNYDPHTHWNVGSQMVALNFQTQDRPMQLNKGLFMDNGGCGYVLKPEFLCSEASNFDARGPFTQFSKLKIRVISGHQLPYSSEKYVKSERALQVTVRVSGVEADNNKDKTKTMKKNGFHVIWQDELSFNVHVPQLAMVQFVVRDGDTFLGQNTVLMRCMQQGYRNIPLYTKGSVLIPNSFLFVHIEKESPTKLPEDGILRY